MILELRDVFKRRGPEYMLRITNLGIRNGEHVAILGPSGCGKSTALDIIGMVLEVDTAREFKFSPLSEVFNIAALWKAGKTSFFAELRRNYIGYILQTGEIFSFLNVADNIKLTALAGGLAANEADERTAFLLERLELAQFAKVMPSTLSIGQRQRVAIARALASSPVLLLADEPTSALDPSLARRVMKLMLDAVSELKAALILVSHDHQLVSEFGFRKVEFRMKGSEAILDEEQ